MNLIGLLLIILILSWLVGYLPPPVPAPGQPYSLLVFILLIILIIYLLKPVLWTF
jgi:hypothetical protein